MALKSLLWQHGITQSEFASGTGVSQAFVAAFIAGKAGALEGTLITMRDWLSVRLGRPVSFDEILSVPPKEGAAA